MHWDAVGGGANATVYDPLVLAVEGHLPRNHGKQQHAQAPDVHLRPDVLPPFTNLWRRVVHGAARHRQHVPRAPSCGKAPITQLGVMVCVQEHIVCLHVAVHHAARVGVVQRGHDLREQAAGFRLGDTPALLDVLEQVAVGRVLEQKDAVQLRLHHLHQLQDVLVVEERHDKVLTLFNFHALLQLYCRLQRDHLGCRLFASLLVLHQLDLGEAPYPKLFHHPPFGEKCLQVNVHALKLAQLEGMEKSPRSFGGGGGGEVV
mmetsp:Transcript_14774/g.37584  ORF Transcript_14774/g.37584 Transcript_14774/m.37584 type:complete len:260 (+) Transcript_14774:299-1078(+)